MHGVNRPLAIEAHDTPMHLHFARQYVGERQAMEAAVSHCEAYLSRGHSVGGQHPRHCAGEGFEIRTRQPKMPMDLGKSLGSRDLHDISRGSQHVVLEGTGYFNVGQSYLYA